MKHVNVTVTTHAGENRVEDTPNLDPNERSLRVWVTAAPDHGRANEAVIDLVAHHLQIAPSLLVIRRGLRGRKKLIEILG